jgi:uncharacterized protein YbgA (DUF1722 family)/uncharacterized protein YbbK (DUF523 family)
MTNKPQVVVSRCLGFEACRWNGVTIPSEIVKRLEPHVTFSTFCPEVEIGLGVPRDPIRLIRSEGILRLVQPSTGLDVSERMRARVQEILSETESAHGFILKSKSPSCGIRDVKIYPGPGKVPVAAKGAGFFGGPVTERHPGLAVEDEARLTNFRIREHFFTKLFTLYRFKLAREQNTMGALVKFHTVHKLLFLAANQKQYRLLGPIVANHMKKPAADVFVDYEKGFVKLFAAIARPNSHMNVLMHTLGYVSNEISKEEKAHFLHLLDLFRDKKIPLSAPLSIMKSWVLRFGQSYLLDQVYFQPFPEDLLEIGDTGKPQKVYS